MIALCVALVCSAALTLITIIPPVVAGDWARLNPFGIYIPISVSYNWPSYGLQASLWFGLTLSLGWVFTSTPFRYTPNIPNEATLPYSALLVGITLLGFGLRLSTLDHLPLLVDEIGFAARASDIAHGQPIPIFAPGHNGNPAVFSWLLSGAMGVFGQSRFAMRVVSLAFGTMSIPAAYALGGAWWSRRVGLIAAVFLATYPVHVYFSRLALYNIVDPFFALLTLAALSHALRRIRLADFVWAGVWAGIGQYFYHGSRLLLLVMIVYIFFYTLNAKTQGRTDAKDSQSHRCASAPLCLCVMFFVFILVSLPRFASMFMADLPLTGNLNVLRLPADLGANVLRSLLAWVGQPDISPFWLSSATLLPVSALLAFGVGLLISLRRLLDARHAVMVAIVLLTTVFGGIIWTASPLYVCYMTALPAIVLLVALPFQTIPELNHRGTENREKKNIFRMVARVLVLVIVVQGIIVSLQQPAESHARVPARLWEQDARCCWRTNF